MQRLLQVIGLLSLSMILLSCDSSTDNPEKVIPAVIENGRLAELPESATEIKAYGWGGGFTGERFVRFKASSEDIKEFVKASESITDVKPEEFDSQHQYLPYPDPLPENFYSRRQKHEYYYPDETAPTWYEPSIKSKGKRYQMPASDRRAWGEVIIDEENNCVYINVVWS